MYLHASNSNQFGIASLSKLWLPVDIVLLPIFLFVNNDMNVFSKISIFIDLEPTFYHGFDKIGIDT